MTDVKKLLEQATPLPWRVDGTDPSDFLIQRADRPLTERCLEDHVVCHGHGYDDYGHHSSEDAALIVHAVNSLPAYEAAVEALERLERLVSVEWDASTLVGLACTDARAALARVRDENTGGSDEQKR